MRLPFLAATVLVTGCAQRSPIAVTAAPQVDAAIQSAASQVKRCYRWPKMAHSGRQISTRIRVRFAEDGTLAEMPALVSQAGVTPENRLYAERMLAAAGEAVIRCAPLRLPPDLYSDGWSSFELTFSPSARV